MILIQSNASVKQTKKEFNGNALEMKISGERCTQ